MSIHEQNASVVETLINSISAMNDVDVQPDLSNTHANRILANYDAAPDIETLLSLFQRHEMSISTFSSIIESYTKESFRTQNHMLTRILDIPPYVDSEVDDFF